ncbi:MAG: hypothetical protein FWG84_02950 [Bacteroidales bacterium]|nr:hypothetical protein [Bacteroidales bacterium]
MKGIRYLIICIALTLPLLGLGTNNDIVRQTDKNFEGFNNVDWGEVGISAAASGVGSFAAYGVGYGAVQAPLINGIRSPLLKSTLLAPVGSAAGHIAGGTTAGLLSGQNLEMAFGNSTKGLGTSITLGIIPTIDINKAGVIYKIRIK